MAYPFVLPSRQVHLDFHTGPGVTDVGVDFDAEQFGETVAGAHINSMTLFAKCHHGHLYYDTKHAARHPGLARSLNLLELQVEALHQRNIRAPIYLSVLCDEFAADTHPEWVAQKEDGAHVGAKPFEAGWQILDMSSPYADYLAEQIAEVLKHFHPVDGIFLDMCWDQVSYNPFTIAGMERAALNPQLLADQKIFARRVSLGYMKRYADMVKAANPAATFYFNSRPMATLGAELEFFSQVEIEALPTGGWGYGYFPKNVRVARNYDRDFLGMTARFHKGWADFGGIKPYPAIEYETSLMMAHGAKVSIGDQLHPRGVLDKAAYELIGKTLKRAKEREEWLTNAKAWSEVGVFQVPTTEYRMDPGADEGAVRMLTQLKIPFDAVNAESDFTGYKLLILPDAIPLDEALGKKLRAYLAGGGKILASGVSGMNAVGTDVALSELGIEALGMSRFTAQYLRFGAEISEEVPPTDHVMYDRSVNVKAVGPGRVVAENVEPYFERAWDHFCSHAQTPGEKVSGFAAAVMTERTAYIASPVFGAYIRHGNRPYRLLVGNILRKLLPERQVEVENAPLSLEVSVMRQAEPGARGGGSGRVRRVIVHLLNYTAEHRTAGLDVIEDITSLSNVKLRLRIPQAPVNVYLAPEGRALEYKYSVGVAEVLVEEVRGHGMVVFELGTA